MKEKALKTLLNASLIMGFFTVLFGLVYPLVILAAGYIFFPSQSKGSLVLNNKKVTGSYLIGQNFQSDKYFHPRNSYAGELGYDAEASNGSYFGPSSKKLSEAVSKQVTEYRTLNQLSDEILVPADAVFSSGSGLDPHISVANAKMQALRIAKSRNLSLEIVNKIIDEHSQNSIFSPVYRAYINVLMVNLALDKIATSPNPSS